MVYPEYLDAIIAYYQDKKRTDQLPQRFVHPTPSKLRDECVVSFNSRFEAKTDLWILENFFGVKGRTAVEKEMQHLQTDRMRPLVNFMKGVTGKPDDKNAELLGFLLDFPARPYDIFKLLNKEVGDQKGPGEDSTGLSDELGRNDEQKEFHEEKGDGLGRDPGRKKGETIRHKVVSSRMVKIVIAVAFVCGLGVYIYYNSSQVNSQGIWGYPKNGCMLWDIDHYEATDCDSLQDMQTVVKLDPTILKNQRKVTKLDSLTSRCIGKLWYQKREDTIDVYTWSGRDPENPQRYLRPVTRYIFEKYISRKFSQATLRLPQPFKKNY